MEADPELSCGTLRHSCWPPTDSKRESGSWAEAKLYYLARYLNAFNHATKNHFDRRVYIDLLAGPGRCYLKGAPTTEFDGSPILALNFEVGFTSVLCVEGDAGNASALKRRIAKCDRAAAALPAHCASRSQRCLQSGSNTKAVGRTTTCNRPPSSSTDVEF